VTWDFKLRCEARTYLSDCGIAMLKREERGQSSGVTYQVEFLKNKYDLIVKKRGRGSAIKLFECMADEMQLGDTRTVKTKLFWGGLVCLSTVKNILKMNYAA
jgi:hypothetical protein